MNEARGSRRVFLLLEADFGAVYVRYSPILDICLFFMSSLLYLL